MEDIENEETVDNVEDVDKLNPKKTENEKEAVDIGQKEGEKIPTDIKVQVSREIEIVINVVGFITLYET